MMKLMKNLKFLEKTDSNRCVTLDSMVIGIKIRNIFDNNDDKSFVDKAWSACLSLVWFPKLMLCVTVFSYAAGFGE